MNHSEESFKDECHGLEAVVGICAAIIAGSCLGAFILIFNYYFTG